MISDAALLFQSRVQKSIDTFEFSLAILKSHFERAQELFWDGPHNFESRSDDEKDDATVGVNIQNISCQCQNISLRHFHNQIIPLLLTHTTFTMDEKFTLGAAVLSDEGTDGDQKRLHVIHIYIFE
ncbi:hypothetical protein AVEN_58471-1 [Araneus ventricosus]|uniref:Uncharacterized protein n=1 Tax=Araneus ventricosus TaxID=182803 RepID=A0A4Y2SF53_ARAVE|nr:hypothetical protein AVEN_58471-1 [Araneus ventricosus]